MKYKYLGTTTARLFSEISLWVKKFKKKRLIKQNRANPTNKRHLLKVIQSTY